MAEGRCGRHPRDTRTSASAAQSRACAATPPPDDPRRTLCAAWTDLSADGRFVLAALSEKIDRQMTRFTSGAKAELKRFVAAELLKKERAGGPVVGPGTGGVGGAEVAAPHRAGPTCGARTARSASPERPDIPADVETLPASDAEGEMRVEAGRSDHHLPGRRSRDFTITGAERSFPDAAKFKQTVALKFFHDSRSMDFDRLWADVHIKSDGLVAFSVSEPVQDVILSGCELGEPLDGLSPSLLNTSPSRLQQPCDR